jgi:peptidyl-prolyl cis-trans isomerase C
MSSNKKFKSLIIFIVAAVFPSICALNAKAEYKPPAELGKIAEVNGVIITHLEFEQILRKRVEDALRRGAKVKELDQKKMMISVVDELVGTELLFQESVRLGLKVSETEIYNIYNKGIDREYKSRDDYKKDLEKAHLTEDYVKLGIEKSLGVEKLIREKFMPSLKTGEADAEKFYEENLPDFEHPELLETRHIMVKVPDMKDQKAKNAALAKIKGIEKRLEQGEDFAKVAKETSGCPSRDKGGVLPPFSKGQMSGLEPYEKAAFALKAGQRSGVVETRFGYHIIELTGKQAAGMVPFGEVKKNIIEMLQNKEMTELLIAKIMELRKKAKVKTYVDKLLKDLSAQDSSGKPAPDASKSKK